MTLSFPLGDLAKIKEEYSDVLDLAEDFYIDVDSHTSITVQGYQIEAPELQLSFHEGVLYELIEEEWIPQYIVGLIYHLGEKHPENRDNVLSCMQGTVEHVLIEEFRKNGYEIGGVVSSSTCLIDTALFAEEKSVKRLIDDGARSQKDLYSSLEKFRAFLSCKSKEFIFEVCGNDGYYSRLKDEISSPEYMAEAATKKFFSAYYDCVLTEENNLHYIHGEKGAFNVSIVYKNSWLDVSFSWGDVEGKSTLPLYCQPADLYILILDLYRAYEIKKTNA